MEEFSREVSACFLRLGERELQILVTLDVAIEKANVCTIVQDPVGACFS